MKVEDFMYFQIFMHTANMMDFSYSQNSGDNQEDEQDVRYLYNSLDINCINFIKENSRFSKSEKTLNYGMGS